MSNLLTTSFTIEKREARAEKGFGGAVATWKGDMDRVIVGSKRT